jgi:hypothetical protein
MTTFHDGNTPTLTLEELGDMVRTALLPSMYSAVDPADGNSDVVTRMSRYVLRSLARHLRTVHFIEVPVTCTPVCTVSLRGLGALNITDIQVRQRGCRDTSCLRPLSWWKMRGTELEVAGVHTNDSLLIEFVAPPPSRVMGVDFTVLAHADTTSFDTDLHTDLTLGWPLSADQARTPVAQEGDVPVAGYLRTMTTPRPYTLEYVGRTFEVVGAAGRIVLHNVTPLGAVASNVVLTKDVAAVQFVARLNDSFPEDVVRAIVSQKYWQDSIASCLSDEDRSFASQMMVFYAGERDKAMKNLRAGGPRPTLRLKYRPDVGTTGWCPDAAGV